MCSPTVAYVLEAGPLSILSSWHQFITIDSVSILFASFFFIVLEVILIREKEWMEKYFAFIILLKPLANDNIACYLVLKRRLKKADCQVKRQLKSWHSLQHHLLHKFYFYIFLASKPFSVWAWSLLVWILSTRTAFCKKTSTHSAYAPC